MNQHVARPPLSLENAIVYDIECLPNCFTLDFEFLHNGTRGTFEISEFRSDVLELLAWFRYWHEHRIPMIGFHILAYDYPIIHFIWNNPHCTVWDIFEKSQEVINDHTMFKMVWESDRFAPQIDLFKIYHMDNPAKMTSLKALQINMRLDNVVEMPLPWEKPIAPWDIDPILIPYNMHDVRSTKQFALFSMEAINFRIGLMETIRGDVLNFPDTKIGAKLLEQRLGDELLYEPNPNGRGRGVMRQTPRDRIALADIIFPYVQFSNPEFQRILNWMRGQVLTSNEFSDKVQTKGVFSGVHATIDGFEFWFGTGGIHGSVAASVWEADDQWTIEDDDVAALYPNIAIKNKLYPEHLGIRFVEEYTKLPAERKEWQKKKGKKCVEANSLKLASNGTYGNSNSEYSPFYDPKFTMTITINGQLLLCMYAEWLLTVPTVQLIQINTDGVTYRVRREHLPAVQEIRNAWQAYTRLELENVQYSKMWIRDVNNYIAKGVDGSLKQKGAYWYPRNFPDDISQAQPPAWHKDFSAQVAIMAAVAHLTEGADIERYIYDHADPFDFMCRAKVKRSETLLIGDKEVQRTQRYYIAREGGAIVKRARPKGTPGHYKRKNGITDSEYYGVLQTLPPDTWDARIHTKNEAKYPGAIDTNLESGWLVADCNKASDFDFNNVNYEYYIAAAKKLVVK